MTSTFDISPYKKVIGQLPSTYIQSTLPPAQALSFTGGSFNEWLSGLPSNSILAPAYDKKRGEPGYIRGVGKEWGNNQVPGMWKAFAPYGKSLIDKSALAKMRGVTSGISGSRRDFERGLLASYRNAGVNSLFARGALAETRPQLGSQIRQARAGVEAERNDETFNLMSAIQNALVESYLSERDMALQLNMASLGRKAGRDGAKSAQSSALIGAAATVAGAVVAGPAGAAAGAALTGAATAPSYQGSGGLPYYSSG